MRRCSGVRKVLRDPKIGARRRRSVLSMLPLVLGLFSERRVIGKINHNLASAG